jgi:hypothetical protein
MKVMSLLAYFLIMKMDRVRSSETSVVFHRITRHHIPEDGALAYILPIDFYLIVST